MDQIIYFDNAATTKPLPEVLSEVNEVSGRYWANSSSSHRLGRQAEEYLFSLQAKAGSIFGVPPSHIVFTSGGTESNNLALWGSLGGISEATLWLKEHGDSYLVTSTIEHPSTKDVFNCLEKVGFKTKKIGVDSEGFLRLEDLEEFIKNNRVRLLSVHHVQNEIGTIQDLERVRSLLDKYCPESLLHIDAVQSFSKIDIPVKKVDLISISAHKFGGPKGIGALILGERFKNRAQKLGKLIHGSSQQWGMRPGTIPIPQVAGLVKAMEIQVNDKPSNVAKIMAVRDFLLQNLPPQVVLNGPKDLEKRAPQTLNISIPGLPGSAIVEALSARGVCVSAGSACSSHLAKASTVFELGLPEAIASSAFRVSLCHDNTIEEAALFIKILEEIRSQYL
ncbi:MAG: cysteine desulfurase family protein [Bacteriovoracia bacterium]